MKASKSMARAKGYTQSTLQVKKRALSSMRTYLAKYKETVSEEIQRREAKIARLQVEILELEEAGK